MHSDYLWKATQTNDWVYNKIYIFYLNRYPGWGWINSGPWLGGVERNGTWVWVEGAEIEGGFNAWHPGEPSGGSEGCMQFFANDYWNDRVCAVTLRYICKIGEFLSLHL